jgi:hemerythrin superfamily protein
VIEPINGMTLAHSWMTRASDWALCTVRSRRRSVRRIGMRAETTNNDGRGKRREESTMNVIDLLKAEHEKAKRAFEDIQAASPDRRAQLWATLAPELKVHEQIEEATLYGPVTQDVGSRDQILREWPVHHQEEVSEAEALIQEIGALDPTGDEWMETVKELQEALEGHIEDEEGDIWPRIQQVWDRSKLERAADEMETLKRRLMSRAA